MSKMPELSPEEAEAKHKAGQEAYDREIHAISLEVSKSLARMLRTMHADGMPEDALVQTIGHNCRIILADMARYMMIFLFNPAPNDKEKQALINALVGRSLRQAADEFEAAHKAPNDAPAH